MPNKHTNPHSLIPVQCNEQELAVRLSVARLLGMRVDRWGAIGAVLQRTDGSNICCVHSKLNANYMVAIHCTERVASGQGIDLLHLFTYAEVGVFTYLGTISILTPIEHQSGDRFIPYILDMYKRGKPYKDKAWVISKVTGDAYTTYCSVYNNVKIWDRYWR